MIPTQMLKTQQERRLAKGFVAVLVVFVLYQTLISPVSWSLRGRISNRLYQEKVQLEKELTQREELSQRQLAAQASSLPADSTIASTRYYTWLYDLASHHNFADIKIDANTPTADPNWGSRLGFSLEARCSPASLGAFLEDLESTDVLHTVKDLQLSDYSVLSKEVRVTASIEALSLLAGARYEELPKAETLQGDYPLKTRLAKSNPFQRYEPPKANASKRETVVSIPKIDPLAKVSFVGVVRRNGQTQAWFFDSLNNTEIHLAIGNRLALSGFEAELVEIGENEVITRHADKLMRIALGQNVRTAMETGVH